MRGIMETKFRIQKWRLLIGFRQRPDLAFRIRETFLNS
jgi:hypothetical protein